MKDTHDLMAIIRGFKIMFNWPIKFLKKSIEKYLDAFIGPTKIQEKIEKEFKDGKVFTLSYEKDYENFEEFKEKTKDIPGIILKSNIKDEK